MIKEISKKTENKIRELLLQKKLQIEKDEKEISDEKIAKKCNVSKFPVQRIKKEMGFIPDFQESEKKRKERDELIIELDKEGLFPSQIGKRVKLSSLRIKEILKQLKKRTRLEVNNETKIEGKREWEKPH